MIEDKKLINRISNFILKLGDLYKKIINGKKLDEKDEWLLQMAPEIVSDLHNILMGNRQKIGLKELFKR